MDDFSIKSISFSESQASFIITLCDGRIFLAMTYGHKEAATYFVPALMIMAWHQRNAIEEQFTGSTYGEIRKWFSTLGIIEELPDNHRVFHHRWHDCQQATVKSDDDDVRGSTLALQERRDGGWQPLKGRDGEKLRKAIFKQLLQSIGKAEGRRYMLGVSSPYADAIKLPLGFGSHATTGDVPRTTEDEFVSFVDSSGLRPWRKAKVVLSRAETSYRLAIDDAIALFIAPDWSGIPRHKIACSIGDNREFDAELTRIAAEHREARDDKDDNGQKLALIGITPLLVKDREHLRVSLQQMLYFDYEGPRRAVWNDDEPTEFGERYFLGKLIPDEIPTPLAVVQPVLTTADGYLVLGIRRKDVESDFPEYNDRLCVTFEEQMRPSDMDVHGTVIRGLEEEAGITGVDPDGILLISIHYEASYASVCPTAVYKLRCGTEELQQSINLKARDHEWDPIFVPDNLQMLKALLSMREVSWDELSPRHHMGEFSPLPTYRWHGSSRLRLLAYTAMKYGIKSVLEDPR